MTLKYLYYENIDYGYTLEPSRRCGSNEYPLSMFWSKIRNIHIPLYTPVLLQKVGFKGLYIIHGHVFVIVYMAVSSFSLSYT